MLNTVRPCFLSKYFILDFKGIRDIEDKMQISQTDRGTDRAIEIELSSVFNI